VVSEPLARYGFGSLGAAALSHDGRLLATAGNGDIVLWDTVTSTALRPIPGPGFTVDSIAFSPDGARLAGSGAQSTLAHVWDLKTGTILLTLSGSSHGIACVAFSPGGARIAAGGQYFNQALSAPARAGRIRR
jgi:WD40 repeat protein